MQNIKSRELVIGGLFIALGILVPIIFHSFGILGQVFLPMHVPVLIGGFFLSPYLALIVGIVTPLISSVLTGMPAIYPMAVIMMFELGTYGLVVSLAVRKIKLSVIPSLILAMLAGRVSAGIAVFILANLFGLKMNSVIFIKGAVLTGLPGIAIQLLFIPALMYSLNAYAKKNLIKER